MGLLLTLIILVSTGPIGYVYAYNALDNIQYLVSIANSISWDEKFLIECIIPPFLFNLCVNLINFLFRWMANYEGHVSHSESQHSTFDKLFYFYLVNGYFLSLMGGFALFYFFKNDTPVMSYIRFTIPYGNINLFIFFNF